MMSENISPQAALFKLKRRGSQYSLDEFYDIICTFDTPRFLFVLHSWVLLSVYLRPHSTLGVSTWCGILIFGFFVDIGFDTIFR